MRHPVQITTHHEDAPPSVIEMADVLDNITIEVGDGGVRILGELMIPTGAKHWWGGPVMRAIPHALYDGGITIYPILENR